MMCRHTHRSGSPDFHGSVASMSLGSETISEALDRAVKLASAAGIHFSVAAGNANADACRSSPSGTSNSSNVVSVGSINVQDRRSKFSNFGDCVTVYAPGNDITSTWIGHDNSTINTISGTSMACPHVSGLMAVFLSQYPSLKNDTRAMKEKIVSMARNITLGNVPGPGNGPGLLVNNGKLMKNNGSPE